MEMQLLFQFRRCQLQLVQRVFNIVVFLRSEILQPLLCEVFVRSRALLIKDYKVYILLFSFSTINESFNLSRQTDVVLQISGVFNKLIRVVGVKRCVHISRIHFIDTLHDLDLTNHVLHILVVLLLLIPLVEQLHNIVLHLRLTPGDFVSNYNASSA